MQYIGVGTCNKVGGANAPYDCACADEDALWMHRAVDILLAQVVDLCVVSGLSNEATLYVYTACTVTPNSAGGCVAQRSVRLRAGKF